MKNRACVDYMPSKEWLKLTHIYTFTAPHVCMGDPEPGAFIWVIWVRVARSGPASN